MHQVQILLAPTGACNLNCLHCAQKEWRKEYKDYHMTPYEVGIFCSRIKEQGLHYNELHILGGEPALWKHLGEGCMALQRSGCFDQIHIYSNCVRVEPLIAVLDAGFVDMVVTQTSNASEGGINKLRERHADKLTVTPQPVHKVHPEEPVPQSIPALCGCDRLMVFDNKVYSCPGAYHNTVRMNWPLDTPKVWCWMSDDWYAYFGGFNRYAIPACSVCLANSNVWNIAIDGNKPDEKALQENIK